MALLEDIQLGAVNGDEPDKKIESVVKQVNEWGRVLSNEGLTQIFKDDSGTNRLLLGKDSAGDYVLKVSQEGNDVYTATNDQLVFNSNNNVFKVVGSGTLEVAGDTLNTGGAQYGGSTTNTTTVAHNLGYTPAILAFWSDADGTINTLLPYSQILDLSSSGFSQAFINCAVTDTDVTASLKLFGYNANTTFQSFTVKYYLYVETAN